jgi:methyl-accepting chemotaxis protein
VKAKADGNAQEAATILEKSFEPSAKIYQDLLQELVTMQRDSIDATAKGIDGIADRSGNLVIILTFFPVAFGVFCS